MPLGRPRRPLAEAHFRCITSGHGQTVANCSRVPASFRLCSGPAAGAAMNFSEVFKLSNLLCRFSPDGKYLVSGCV